MMSRFTPRSGVALLTCAVALTVALVSASTGCESGQYLAPGHIWVPCFRPPKCASGTAALTNFTLANATAPMPEQTEVEVCVTDSHLVLTYVASDDKLMKNTYTECNTETWNQEVMEVFIADQSAPMTPAGDPTLYTEIELTPHNVLYVAKIHNPYGNGTDKHNTMIPCPASGINHTVERDPSDPNHTWIGKVQIPWTLVSTKGKPAPEALYRVNFFRVAMVEDVDVCDADTCDFGCWSPTYTQPPSFHVTPYFGVMSLV